MAVSDHEPRVPDARMIPPWRPPPAPEPWSQPEPTTMPGPDDVSGVPGDEPGDQALVRPFLITGGRTRPLHDGLRVETLVSAKPAAMFAPLRFELRGIVELCQRPRSVAEIAAHFSMPLGVARVLIADLIADGYVSRAQETEPATLPIEVIERIRDRVRAL